MYKIKFQNILILLGRYNCALLSNFIQCACLFFISAAFNKTVYLIKTAHYFCLKVDFFRRGEIKGANLPLLFFANKIINYYFYFL